MGASDTLVGRISLGGLDLDLSRAVKAEDSFSFPFSFPWPFPFGSENLVVLGDAFWETASIFPSKRESTGFASLFAGWIVCWGGRRECGDPFPRSGHVGLVVCTTVASLL